MSTPAALHSALIHDNTEFFLNTSTLPLLWESTMPHVDYAFWRYSDVIPILAFHPEHAPIRRWAIEQLKPILFPKPIVDDDSEATELIRRANLPVQSLMNALPMREREKLMVRLFRGIDKAIRHFWKESPYVRRFQRDVAVGWWDQLSVVCSSFVFITAEHTNRRDVLKTLISTVLTMLEILPEETWAGSSLIINSMMSLLSPQMKLWFVLITACCPVRFQQHFLTNDVVHQLRTMPSGALSDALGEWKREMSATTSMMPQREALHNGLLLWLERDASVEAASMPGSPQLNNTLWEWVKSGVNEPFTISETLRLLHAACWRSSGTASETVDMIVNALKKNFPASGGMPWDELTKDPGLKILYHILLSPHKSLSDCVTRVPIHVKQVLEVLQGIPTTTYKKFPRTCTSALRITTRIIRSGLSNIERVPFSLLWASMCTVILDAGFAPGHATVLHFVAAIPDRAFVPVGCAGKLLTHFSQFVWKDLTTTLHHLMALLEGSAPSTSEVSQLERVLPSLSSGQLDEIQNTGGWISTFVNKSRQLQRRSELDKIFDENMALEARLSAAEQEQRFGDNHRYDEAYERDGGEYASKRRAVDALQQPVAVRLRAPPQLSAPVVRVDDPSVPLTVIPRPVVPGPRVPQSLLSTHALSSSSLQAVAARDATFAAEQHEKRRAETLRQVLDSVVKIVIGADDESKPKESLKTLQDSYLSVAEFADVVIPYVLCELREDVASQLREYSQAFPATVSKSYQRDLKHVVFNYAELVVGSNCSDDRPLLYKNDVVAMKAKGVESIGVVTEISTAKSSCFTVVMRRAVDFTECRYRRLFSLQTTLSVIDTVFYLERTPYYNLILKPSNAKNFAVPDVSLRSVLGPQLVEYLSNFFNASQLQAISWCLANTTMPTLIQGPPGTGKTHTILGILSCLITAARVCGGKHQNILVCAPSNTAVDEAMTRVMRYGIRDNDANPFRPKTCRLGVRDKVHPEIIQRGKFLDDVVRAKLSGKDGTTTANNSNNGDWSTVRADILKSCSVVFSTIGALRDIPFKFDVVIIDEAAQAVEPQCVYAMSLAKKCILVGDPMQLPATILSIEALTHNYQRSLMARLLSQGHPYVMLNIQYRMHAVIADFASKTFYGGKVKNGHRKSSLCFQQYEGKRYMFMDVRGQEQQVGKSFSNRAEVDAVVDFVSHLRSSVFPNNNPYNSNNKKDSAAVSIGIITHYSAQKRAIDAQLQEDIAERQKRMDGIVMGSSATSSADGSLLASENIDVNTVDGFQGKERDIILISCVRTGKSATFLADMNRVNVALTRAKEMVVIFGSATMLKSASATWRDLLDYIEKN
eukprot:PhM_4_TR2115/c0_g1_i2/m.57640/K10706/SETX, ALS4; senataxin